MGTKVQLLNKLMKEVMLCRVAGPFSSIPFENFIQSPIGFVPKDGSDQTRLNFHLSYKFKEENMESVNFCMPEHKCSVKYRDLDFAVKTYLDLCDEIIKSQDEQSSRWGHETRPQFENHW